MEPAKVSIREFREKLAFFLEAKTPVAITLHGEMVDLYIPTRRKITDEDRAALKSAAAQVNAMLKKAGVSEDDLLEDFKEARRLSRKN